MNLNFQTNNEDSASKTNQSNNNDEINNYL